MLRPVSRELAGIKLVVGTPFLYIEESASLVMSDLHLGFEEAASMGLHYSLRKTSGFYAVFLPRIQLKRVIELLGGVLGKLVVKRVVVNGDLKHAFDRLLKQEREEVVRLVNYLREMGVDEVMVVRGNHDNFIKPVLRKLRVEFINSLVTTSSGKRVLVTHGHEDVDYGEYDVVVIGHEHPSIRCFDVYRFPCILKIPLENNKTLIVMPATGPYHPGVTVTPNPVDYLSPLIRKLTTLKDMSIITWIDLGEISPSSVEYFESFNLGGDAIVEKHVVGSREYAVIEFRNYEVARLVCEV